MKKYTVSRPLAERLKKECLRIIDEAQPKWWVIENPGMGRLRDFLGKPVATYQPYQYGSPWTKKTSLWGNFNMPPVKYPTWEDCPTRIPHLWIKRRLSPYRKLDCDTMGS
jgi:hypothetical protein